MKTNIGGIATRYKYKWPKKANLRVGDVTISFENGEKFNVAPVSSKKYKIWFDSDPADAVKVSRETLDKLLDRCVRLKSKSEDVIEISHVRDIKTVKAKFVIPKKLEGKFSNPKVRNKTFKDKKNVAYVEKVLSAYLRQALSKRKDWEGTKHLVIGSPSKDRNVLSVTADVCLSNKPWDCVNIGYSWNPGISALSFVMTFEHDCPNPKKLVNKKTAREVRDNIEKIKKSLTKKFGMQWGDFEFPMWPRLMVGTTTKFWRVETVRFA